MYLVIWKCLILHTSVKSYYCILIEKLLVAENAIIEIPDEKTPLDHFIQPDEDRMKSIRQVQLERDDAIKKLDKYFSSTFDTRLVKFHFF